jgi:hypothetical protein
MSPYLPALCDASEIGMILESDSLTQPLPPFKIILVRPKEGGKAFLNCSSDERGALLSIHGAIRIPPSTDSQPLEAL